MMGEAIESQTGWNITFLVGGPEPINEGKIMTYMYARIIPYLLHITDRLEGSIAGSVQMIKISRRS